MFQALVISKKQDVRRISLSFVFISLGVHFGLLGYLILNDFLVIPEIKAPAVQVSLLDSQAFIAPPPPVPPAAQAVKTKGNAVKKNDTPEPVKPPSRDKYDLLAPSKIPPELQIGSLAPELGSDSNDLAVPGGLKGGHGNTAIGPLIPNPDQSIYEILTGEMTRPQKIFAPPPTYPELAVKTGISCRVIVEAKIDVNGTVADVTILKSCPIFVEQFDQAVREALRNWKFSPATLNGIPVPVRYALTIQFTVR
ncbi:energy transducer TonB [candidate division CSSED10-310 bacterium]|uniref:Energy transducer TonB n=1 Tax=candidate division CSSED10-310 bacterium TaxID=2855610 RepID=A0ABV6Z5V7_UNCC1